MYVILGYRATLILPKNILLFAKILFFFDKTSISIVHFGIYPPYRLDRLRIWLQTMARMTSK